MSNFSLVGCRFWPDFQRFYKFFIGSFHLQEVSLRYVYEDSEKWMRYLVLYLKNCILNVFQLLISSIAFCCYHCCRRFLYIISLPSEGPALHTQVFTVHFLWTPAKKTNVLKPRILETAAFIASIKPGKSMSACAMNTFKTDFFFSRTRLQIFGAPFLFLSKSKEF